MLINQWQGSSKKKGFYKLQHDDDDDGKSLWIRWYTHTHTSLPIERAPKLKEVYWQFVLIRKKEKTTTKEGIKIGAIRVDAEQKSGLRFFLVYCYVHSTKSFYVV
jgi:hypothetical protein